MTDDKEPIPMAIHYTPALLVKFADENNTDYMAQYPVEIHHDSYVQFRGDSIKISDIEKYVSDVETEMAEAYLAGDDRHHMKEAALQAEIARLNEVIGMYEAALASANKVGERK